MSIWEVLCKLIMCATVVFEGLASSISFMKTCYIIIYIVMITYMQVSLDTEMEKLENSQKADFLEHLKNLDVSNTRYLVAKQPQFQADREIVISPNQNIVPKPAIVST